MAKIGEEIKETSKNEFTLSSGVVVRFTKKLKSSAAQRIIVDTFNNANLDSTGRVKENASQAEQLALAKRMYEYNLAMITYGVYSGAIEIVSGMPNDNNWLYALKMIPSVKRDMPDIDFGNNMHQRILFLFYEAFQDETDLEILSDNLLDR